MNNVSFGSGTNLLGAPASAILGMPGAMQQSPASGGFTPGVLPPPPAAQSPMNAPQPPQASQFPGPQMPPAPGSQSVPTQPMAQVPQNPVGMPPGIPESTHIIKALISYLASITKAKEMQRGQV